MDLLFLPSHYVVFITTRIVPTHIKHPDVFQLLISDADINRYHLKLIYAEVIILLCELKIRGKWKLDNEHQSLAVSSPWKNVSTVITAINLAPHLIFMKT